MTTATCVYLERKSTGSLLRFDLPPNTYLMQDGDCPDLVEMVSQLYPGWNIMTIGFPNSNLTSQE